jgi:5-methylthioadenosine/S-adenosylhomocysteine deaminase
MDTAAPIDLLVSHGLVVTMDDDWQLIEDGAVAVRGSDIVDVGSATELEERYRDRSPQVIDARGGLIMPGLINTHTHGADSLFRGLIDDLPLEPWLDRLWKVEKAILGPDSVRAGARLAYAEMIKGGTTTGLDMFWFPTSSAEAAREAGFRVLTGPVWFDSTEIDGLDADARRQVGEEFVQEYRSDPLVTPCVMAHGTYTVGPEGLADARDLADRHGTLLSTHLSETAAEVSTVEGRYGRRPPDHLEQLGMLGPRTVLAHCVHVEPEEIDLLARRRVVVAHCPLSNLKLGSGVAPLPDMRQAGVRLSLGTDGPVSGNDLDMWLTLRLTGVLHKGVRQDPTLFAAREVVAMATREAADALGKGDEIGSLEPGKRADLIVIGLDRPHLTPLFDVYSHLVYAVGRDDVESAVINGRVVMRERELLTIDEASVIAQVREIGATIGAS